MPEARLMRASVKLKLRTLNVLESAEIERRANAPALPARSTLRARIIWDALTGYSVSDIAKRRRCTRAMVVKWLARFNALGLAGLDDVPHAGRPRTYTPAEVSTVVATAVADPQQLQLPFGSWTLDRLEQYLNEQHGIAIKRSRIDSLLRAEGLRWSKQESRYGEWVASDFTEKVVRQKA
jgi:transposase